MKKLLTGMLLVLLMAACSPDTATPTAQVATDAQLSTQTSAPTTIPATITPTLTPSATATQPALPTATEEPVLYGPGSLPVNVNPLTGLFVTDPDMLERRPVAVKINLVPRFLYRPPWGLSLADIVYDYYHNDGYTRLHAIFYGNEAELVGPIRSGRFPDHDLVRMYQSIFAYGSADATINQRLLNAEYANRLVLEGDQVNCPPTPVNPLCRHDPAGGDLLLGSTTAIRAYSLSHGGDDNKPNLEGMTFYPVPPEDGADGSQVYIRYSGDNYMRWDYDPISGRYLRFQDNVYDTGQGEEYAPLTDRLDEQQIATDNVVIVFVRHEYYQRPPNEIVEILLSGSGKAYIFRDGQMYEVVWNRPNTNSVLFLTYPDGTAFPFKPGTTWFQLVGETTLMEEQESGVWRFTFGFP
ncbi:MAG: DUF3048 C-terminal domain-containing protein [Anaerolineales bacterium]|nr:DUF3048 C-terminal domain-containing protein [Anaerolineales bacterium]